MPQPDYRIHEMNKRLQQRTDDSDNLWWDAFATEFFEDDANLTLTFCLEDGPKRFSKLFSFFMLWVSANLRVPSCRYWSHAYSTVLSKHLRRWCDGLTVRAAAPQRILSQHKYNYGL